jgi:hypothetical protein
VQNNSLNTAVLFLVYNRPDNTKQVFESIRQAKPPRLYIAADGAKDGKPSDAERVKEVRKISTAVDWPCEVKTFFRDKNLGCKEACSQAIDWFFEQEEQGIILEDDCVPHLDFFAFCENLLDHYCNDERISVISGDNFQNMKWRGDASYYFSKYTHIWGWATWRRAWKHYQGDMNFWPDWKISNDWKKYKSDKVERKYWQKIFDRCYAGQIDTWDYPWMASIWYKKGLTAIPNVNLVSNIGFGEDATHTKDKSNKFSKIPTSKISHIIHPSQVIINIEADKFIFDNICGGKFLRFPFNWFFFPRRVFNYILRKIITYKKL